MCVLSLAAVRSEDEDEDEDEEEEGRKNVYVLVGTMNSVHIERESG